MEWENGRELSRITRGSKIWDFTYDMAGVRSGKTVTTIDTSTGEITGTTEYKYTTLSGKLVRVEYNTTILDIVYDESGQPFSIRYKSSPTATGALYYYVLNAQGDVIGLLNASGELVVEYKYDPWGKLLETIIGVDETDPKYAAYNNMGLRNPLRYRGYIYDRDTGLYYLQSRYYDPAIGRFINADAFASTDVLGLLSTNMFAYCENNPVIYADYSGKSMGKPDIPQYGLFTDGYVHRKVLQYICGKEAYSGSLQYQNTCIYYNGVDRSDGWGFCDLINIDTGEIWELKKDSTSWSCTTEQAQLQLSKYLSGRLRRDPLLELKKPYVTQIAPTAQKITFINGVFKYNVKYWDEGGGILRYSYTREMTDGAKAALFIGIGAIIGAIFHTPPVPIPAI